MKMLTLLGFIAAMYGALYVSGVFPYHFVSKDTPVIVAMDPLPDSEIEAFAQRACAASDALEYMGEVDLEVKTGETMRGPRFAVPSGEGLLMADPAYVAPLVDRGWLEQFRFSRIRIPDSILSSMTEMPDAWRLTPEGRRRFCPASVS